VSLVPKTLKVLLSRRQERHLADLIPHAETTPASGSRRESHDVQTRPNDTRWRFRYEAKQTQAASISFKLSAWQQLVNDTYSRGSEERPAWAIRFDGKAEGIDVPVLQDLIVVDLNDWVELLEELEKLRGKQAEE
jgi:hypothetical protein